MRWRSERGTAPRNTSASVPRLTAETSARTTTSPAPGAASVSRRISPAPGRATQKARASVTQDAVVEQILAELEAAHARAQARRDRGDLGQDEARPAGAEQHRRDRELEPV